MNHQRYIFLLRELFENPEIAFIHISRENIAFLKHSLRRYFTFSFITILIASTTRGLFYSYPFTEFIKKVIIEPSVIFFAFILFLYILSVIVEESAVYYGGRRKPLIGLKICFFSTVPSLSMMPLAFFPIVGKLFFVLAIGNWIYLICTSTKVLLFLPSANLPAWIISVIFCCVLTTMLFLILLVTIQFIFCFF